MWCHGQIYMVCIELTKVQHLALSVEPYHGMLALEFCSWLLQIHVKIKPMPILSIGKQRSEAHAVGDSKLVIQHRLACVHKNLATPKLKPELLVDGDGVTACKKIHNMMILSLIASLEMRQLHSAAALLMKCINISWILKCGGNDLIEHLRLLDEVLWIRKMSLSNKGDISKVRRWPKGARLLTIVLRSSINVPVITPGVFV